ncbi:MAG: FixH family protein [Pseudomonadota bacterium]
MTTSNTIKASHRSSGQFTGRHMLLVMLGFFGVIIAVNLTMATIARQSWTGLVVKNSYVASQKYNEHLAAARSQKALGWKGAIGYRGAALEFTLFDQAGNPVLLDNPSVSFGRPAFEAEDRTVDLTYLGDGLYRLQSDLASGLWQVVVEGNHSKGSYRLETRLFVSGDADRRP